MTVANYTIRVMRREEVDLAVEWAAIEGWNPGVHDAECFYAADPDGFLIGLLDDEPISVISAVKYGKNFGFLGFYIVKPDYRNKGYGIQIWNAAMQKLAGRTIGLDGVVDQQENYKKSGFNYAYRNVRYEGTAKKEKAKRSDIVSLSTLAFEKISSYDRAFFPENRTSFLESWINQSDSKAMGILQNGDLAGYGVIRKCCSGYKIGPLFADTPEFADVLFHSLQATLEQDASFYLDIPEVNQAAVSLVKRNNMKMIFETARMYTGEQPALPLNCIFGVSSFELG